MRKPSTWRDKIRRFSAKSTYAPAATASQLNALERSLKVALPQELRDLLLESNGVQGEYGLGLVWPAETIESDNRSFRTKATFRKLFMPFDHLLFFADAGNGDQFAFAVVAGQVRRPDIFAWNHEDDSRIWVAPSLEKYLEWWLSGVIKL
jgi:hypothetical protein